MKHIKFTFAEPIVGIEYVHNEVFLDEENILCVASREFACRIRGMLIDLNIPLAPCLRLRHGRGGYNRIKLKDGYHFDACSDEIFVMRGNNDIYVVDEFGNKIEDYETHPDWDINDVYPLCK